MSRLTNDRLEAIRALDSAKGEDIRAWPQTAADVRDLLQHIDAIVSEADPTAVPMLLWCPACGQRHIDEGDFATKVHHTHACQSCGMVWRPAIGPTVGVQFLPGFKNPEPAPPEQEPVEPTDASLVSRILDSVPCRLGGPAHKITANGTHCLDCGRSREDW